MSLSSDHWFRVTGSGTFLLMMIVALFALQSSMAHPSSTSSFRPSIHEYQEKQANRSALTLSGSLPNSSTPSNDTHACKYNYCGNCGPHSVCINRDGVTCACNCEVGYVDWMVRSNCTLYGCVVYDNVTAPKGSCIWNNSYCIASEQLCVCKPGFEPRPSEVNFECQPIPGWTTTSTTTSSTVSTSPSPPSSTTTINTKHPTKNSSSSSSTRNILICCLACMFIVVFSGLFLYKMYIDIIAETTTPVAITFETSDANYRRQATQPSPANSKVTSKVCSKVTSKVTSNVTSKVTSKTNPAKTKNKHQDTHAQAGPSKSTAQPKVSTLKKS